MDIRSSLRRKSIVALSFYLCFFIATIATVTYLVTEPPVRAKLEQNLDLRTQLLAQQINQPLASSRGMLLSIVGLAQTYEQPEILSNIIPNLLLSSDPIVVSGGVWPEPSGVQGENQLTSLFFNRSSPGVVDQIHSYNNPETGGYHNEAWYLSVVGKPPSSVVWSDVYVDPFTHVQMITASSPYYLNGQFAGVTTVDLSLETLFDFIAQHAEEYQLGVVIKDRQGLTLSEHNFNLVEGIYISALDFGEFNWHLDVVNSGLLVADEVIYQVSSVEQGLMPFLLLCVLVGYYLLNRYVIKPIIDIAHKVEDSKTGGIIDIDYRSNDEIGQLIHSFNQKTVYLEAEKVKAQASTEAKTAFLATLSHEIRTPMNGVLGTAQILLKTDLNEEQRKHMKTLYDSGDHMMTLLNEILDFSKIEQGHLDLDKSPFALQSIIGSIYSVYHTLCSEKGLMFHVANRIEETRWYHSDKARIRQVLFNLLNNSVKFTAKGEINVEFNELDRDGQCVLQIKVTDTGIGIAKDAQERIFSPFEQAESSTTRRFGGTGLGLAIVKRICEHMDGDISVASVEGQGTVFTVELAVDTCEPIAVKEMSRSKLNYQGLRALVVEDNRTNAIILETFLRRKGFDVHCVEDGQQAIDVVTQRQFDLIFMDNHMPVLDGVEAIAAIRTMMYPTGNVLIFGCTADVFIETKEKMLGVGANQIIAKPIVEAELDDALYQHVGLLYQYQPYKRFDTNLLSGREACLVNLHIALDENNLPKMHTAFEQIQTLLGPQEPPVAEILDNIAANLAQGQMPTAEDIDMITVLLANEMV